MTPAPRGQGTPGPEYRIERDRNGKPCIHSQRGLVASMEAGYGLTREQDAAMIVARLNAHDELLALAKAAAIMWEGSTKQRAARLDVIREDARALLARIGGGK